MTSSNNAVNLKSSKCANTHISSAFWISLRTPSSSTSSWKIHQVVIFSLILRRDLSNSLRRGQRPFLISWLPQSSTCSHLVWLIEIWSPRISLWATTPTKPSARSSTLVSLGSSDQTRRARIHSVRWVMSLRRYFRVNLTTIRSTFGLWALLLTFCSQESCLSMTQMRERLLAKLSKRRLNSTSHPGRRSQHLLSTCAKRCCRRSQQTAWTSSKFWTAIGSASSRKSTTAVLQPQRLVKTSSQHMLWLDQTRQKLKWSWKTSRRVWTSETERSNHKQYSTTKHTHFDYKGKDVYQRSFDTVVLFFTHYSTNKFK